MSQVFNKSGLRILAIGQHFLLYPVQKRYMLTPANR